MWQTVNWYTFPFLFQVTELSLLDIFKCHKRYALVYISYFFKYFAGQFPEFISEFILFTTQVTIQLLYPMSRFGFSYFELGHIYIYFLYIGITVYMYNIVHCYWKQVYYLYNLVWAPYYYYYWVHEAWRILYKQGIVV